MPLLSQYCSQIQSYFQSEKCGPKIIYTVMFGNSDDLKQPRVLESDFEYYCVTDRRDLQFGIWRPIIVPTRYRDSRRTARVFKILPNLIWQDLELSVFVDASISLREPMRSYLEAFCKDAKISCVNHGVRDCVYEEVLACMEQGKDKPEAMQAQVRSYRAVGYPEHNGLITSGVLVRDHRDLGVQELMMCWMQEVDKHSVRDQLSFNYASWKTSVGYNSVDIDIFDNRYFEVWPHRSFRRFDEKGKDVSSRYEKARHRLHSLRTGMLYRLRRLKRLSNWC